MGNDSNTHKKKYIINFYIMGMSAAFMINYFSKNYFYFFNTRSNYITYKKIQIFGAITNTLRLCINFKFEFFSLKIWDY